jgi:ATP-dependent DNA helicase RecQ
LPSYSYNGRPSMDPQSSESKSGARAVFEAVLRRTLLLDLEVSPRGVTLKLGAVLGNRKLTRPGNTSWEAILRELNHIAEGADCVLRHNLVEHDLPFLRERASSLSLFRLPVIDTLVLSPISFTENPFHRLVKDYKWVKESINNPVADARQAASLFADELQSLNGLRQTEPRICEVLHFLLATPDQQAVAVDAHDLSHPG